MSDTNDRWTAESTHEGRPAPGTIAGTPPGLWAGQWLHLASLTVLLPLVWLAWKRIGEPFALVFWIAVAIPIAHQVFVWLAWRLELRSSTISRTIGFRTYLALFFLLLSGRLVCLLVLAWMDRGSLGLSILPRALLTAILGLMWLYLGHGLLRYFGFARAAGDDHFDPSYRDRPLVRQGIFRFTGNGMYVFGFLGLWAIAIGFDSMAALVVSAFSHAYIWVHFLATEKPDMKFLYSDDRPVGASAGVTGVLTVLLPVLVLGGCSRETPPQPASGDHLVLLHGLARSSGSMKLLERHFEDLGYQVLNVDYPGRSLGIAGLVGEIRGAIEPLCESEDVPVHFVTHSMGGVLLRYYVKHYGCPALGRAVMLAPPNHGTELVDRLGEGAFFRWATGPAAQELGTGPGSILRELGPVDFDLGVITGNASISPVTSAMIPGEDDGVVSVESARVEGMRDFLVVPSTHSFIMTSQTVIEQTQHFIETGSFRPGSGEPTYPRR